MMDLGGSNWFHRRPGSLFLKLFFHLFLLLSRPFPISYRRVTGETVTVARAFLHSPSTSPTVSMVRAHGESPLANTDGRFKNSRSWTNSSDLSAQILSSPSASVGLPCSIHCNSEVSTFPGSGFDELWSLDSQRYYSHIQLGKLFFRTSICPLFPSPAVCHSQALRFFPLTGNCNHSLCLSRRDRYNFLKPIVPNTMIKFHVDGGVNVHGIDGVLDSVGIVVLSPNLCYKRTSLFNYRRSTALLTGPRVSVFFSCLALEVSVDDMRCIEVAKSYKAQICSEEMPESYRRCEENTMAALNSVEKLGRTVSVGIGPVSAFDGLYYQKGFKPSIKTTQTKNYRIKLDFKSFYKASVLCLKFDIFCIVGLTSRMESLDSMNFKM